MPLRFPTSESRHGIAAYDEGPQLGYALDLHLARQLVARQVEHLQWKEGV